MFFYSLFPNHFLLLLSCRTHEIEFNLSILILRGSSRLDGVSFFGQFLIASNYFNPKTPFAVQKLSKHSPRYNQIQSDFILCFFFIWTYFNIMILIRFLSLFHLCIFVIPEKSITVNRSLVLRSIF